MSGPIDRSLDADGVSPYAPKWARDRDNASGKRVGPQLPLAGGEETVTMVPADSPEFRLPRSLAPSPVPEPPIRGSWLRDSARSLARSGRGGSAVFPFLLTVFLAALIAFVIVAEWPKIQSVVAKQLAPNSFAMRFGSDPPRPAVGSGTSAVEPRPASAEHSNNAPTTAEQRAATNRAANAPVSSPSPIWPTQPAIAVPAPANVGVGTSPPTDPASAFAALPPANVTNPAAANPMPATSPSATPTLATPSPSEAKVAKSAASVPVASVKTVPVQPAKPVRSLGPDEINTLLKQGEDFVSVGDFASARLVFRRVWEANEVRGALAFAATYDPIVLARIGAKGATPDVARAREWYLKAGELGSPDAARRLEALAKGAR